MKKINIELDFCGTATLGQRGQIVVPIEARKKLGFKQGDKLVVICRDGQILALMKTKALGKVLAQFTKPINALIKKTKK